MSELQLQEYKGPSQQDTVPPSELIEQPVGQDWALGDVSIEVYKAPVSQVLVEVSNQLAVSVVVPADADQSTISVKYENTKGQQVIEDIADHLGLVSEFDGSAVRFLKEDQATHDFVVVRSGYKRSADLVEDLESLLNNNVKVRAVDDRIVVTGKRRDLEQVKRLEKHLQTGPDGWTLNVRIVGVTDSFRRELGLDWDLSAKVGFSAKDLSGVFNSDIAVQIIAEATQTQTDAFLAYQATVHVLEGSSSELVQGRRVPVPRYQTSPEGTTTVVGYEYIEAGFRLDVTAERVPVGVRLQLEPSISAVTGFVADAPITEESSVKSDVVVQDGQWVIITGLASEQMSSSTKSTPFLKELLGHQSRVSDMTSLLVLVQASRTFGT
jgi:type II secretory pathway component GspD/PulD (secretin)